MKCPKCDQRWKHVPYEPIERSKTISTNKGKVHISIDRFEYDGDWMAQYMVPGDATYSHQYGKTAKEAFEKAADHVKRKLS